MTPERFERDLNSRMGTPFDTAYRVRESPDHQAYLVEVRVGRGTYETPLGEGDERYARVRDGYALVLRTLKYPYFRCGECNMTLQAPTMLFGEVTCPHCPRQDSRSIYFVGYFPLCDRLLDHLERTHPKRGDAWAREDAAANAARTKADARANRTHIEGIVDDHLYGLRGIDRVYLNDTHQAR